MRCIYIKDIALVKVLAVSPDDLRELLRAAESMEKFGLHLTLQQVVHALSRPRADKSTQD